MAHDNMEPGYIVRPTLYRQPPQASKTWQRIQQIKTTLNRLCCIPKRPSTQANPSYTPLPQAHDASQRASLAINLSQIS